MLTPCTQGCLRTCAALRRSVASRTSSFEMRSLAPSVMWAQSFSGNSYLPCWMLSNRWLWGGNISQYAVKLKHHDNIHTSSPSPSVTHWHISLQLLYRVITDQSEKSIQHGMRWRITLTGWWQVKHSVLLYSWSSERTWQVRQVSPRSQPQSVPQWPVKGGLPLNKM